MSGSAPNPSGGPRHTAVERVMGYDGASDRPSGSQRGSQAGSQSGSRAGSQAGGSPPKTSGQASGTTQQRPVAGQPGGPAALGYDPARMERPPLNPTELVGKRVDLPPDAYKTGKDDHRFAARPGYNTDGKGIQVMLNIFPIIGWQDKDIYQYDFNVSPNDKDSRALVKKVWNSRPVQDFIKAQGGMWLYDGHKLAWSSEKIPRNEARIIVDLDAVLNKPRQKKDKPNTFYCTIKQTKLIRLTYLKSYILGKISWDSHVLECINFFDHCIRQFPSESLLSIKRNFYDREAKGAALDTYVEVIKGVYSAIRLSESIKYNGTGLAINVDVCNTAFWSMKPLHNIAFAMIRGQKDMAQVTDGQVAGYLQPILKTTPAGQNLYLMSEMFKVLRRFMKLKFKVNHRGKLGEDKIYTVKRLVFDEKYGKQGGNAKNITFEKRQPDGSTRTVTVFQHFLDAYNIRLRFYELPIIETSRGAYFPLEVCNVAEHQRYQYKLEPEQTAKMIKFAVTRPDKRGKDIMEGMKSLKWNEDPYLKAFGIKIRDSMASTNARLLQNPEITFGANAKVNPGVSGRWDLRGKKFLESNMKPLTSWGVIGCGDACQRGDLEQFARKFSDTYRGHGGDVKQPAFVDIIPYQVGDFGAVTEIAYNKTGHHFKGFPQILFFVVATKNMLVYERLKKNMDCRWNLPSQVVQGGHVKKCQPQYLSNVAMKVNSKLGGVTCKVAGPNPQAPPFFRIPTMIIGLDVSHASPGSSQPSMAAMTVSIDRHATRYAAACETNGWRVEVVNGTTLQTMFPRLLDHWKQVNKATPLHVYYFRDGVSEGQFDAVITQEVREFKRIFREKNFPEPKFTVVIATKRHNIRFFPKPTDRLAGDRNHNALPGTLVEHDATHPHHFDFYLCSHVAIQGTARPVHYQVILDEAGCKPNDLQKMIYQQCYQYCRSTTPVSLHPAVYYSHLASMRARCHENLASSQREFPGGKLGFPVGKDNSEIYSGPKPTEAPPLVAMYNPKQPREVIYFMNTTMWYV